jgi:hypothetical protein
MSTPKRHHYLPEFYLEKFSRNNILFVFDRELNKYRKQTPINTAVEKHYYTLEDGEGKKNTEIETFLSQIEGKTKPIIEKLEIGENISEKEKGVLSIFVSFLMNRVPDFEKAENDLHKKIIQMMSDMMFCDEKRTKSVMDQYERDTGKKLGVSPKVLVDFHKNVPHEYKIHRNLSLEAMCKTSFDTAHYLRQMDWVLFHAPHETSFITTDNPFVLIPPMNYTPEYIQEHGIGIVTRGTKKIVPLTQNLCLVMRDHGKSTEHRNINRELVRNINIHISYVADRFVIGRDKALVENMVKTTRLDQWKYKGRLKVD